MTATVVLLAAAVLLLALLLAGAVGLWAIASGQADRLRDDLQRERHLHTPMTPSTLYEETCA